MEIRGFIKDWLKFFSIGGLCLVIAGLSLFYFNFSGLKAASVNDIPLVVTESNEELSSRKLSENSVEIKNESSETAEVMMFGKDTVRLSANSVVEFHMAEKGVKVLLKKGELWASRLRGDPLILIQTGSLVVFPSLGSVSVSADGPFVRSSYSPVFSAQWEAGETIPEWVDIFDVNNPHIFVTYPFETSKGNALFQEKREGMPCPSEKGCANSHPWFDKNKKRDDDLIKEMRRDLFLSVKERGVHFLNIPGALFSTEKNILFLSNLFAIRNKVESENIKRMASRFFEDVLFFASIGRQKEADIRFSMASSFIGALSREEQAEFWYEKYREFAWITAMDEFASLRDAIRFEAMKYGGEHSNGLLALESSRDLFSILSSSSLADFNFRLKKYESEIDNFFPETLSETDPSVFYGLNEKLLLSILEKRPETVFSRDFFDTLSFFEKKYVAGLSGTERKAKIASILIERLRWLEYGVSLIAKTQSVSRIKDGIAVIASDAERFAIDLPVDDEARMEKEKYFDLNKSMLAFILSAEFKGKDSFTVQYDAFLKKKEENLKIESLLFGSYRREDDITYDENAVEEQLKSIGLDVFTVEKPEEGEWYGIYDAVFSGLPFRASYNPRREIFRNIKVDGKRYPLSISLEKFSLFILGTVAKNSSVETEGFTGGINDENMDISNRSESRFETLLRLNTTQRLQDEGVNLNKTSLLTIENIEDSLIKIESVEFRGAPAEKPVQISFMYGFADDKVSDLKVFTPLGEIFVAESFSLHEIIKRANLIFERAVLESDRLEEESKRNEDDKVKEQSASEAVGIEVEIPASRLF